jgi:hypothetical protein
MRRTTAGVSHCVTAQGSEECPDGEAFFPRAGGCERIGTPCPEDDFGEVAGDVSTAYVLAGAMDGDGSRDAPFGSFAEAEAMTGVSRVVVGSGDYPAISVRGVTEIIGVCPERTRIATLQQRPDVTGPQTIENMRIGSLSAQHADMTVRNADLGVITVADVGIEAEHVAVGAGGANPSTNTTQGVVRLRDAVIKARNTENFAANGANSLLELTDVRATSEAGIEASAACFTTTSGTVLLTRVAMTGCPAGGVHAYAGAQAVLRDVVVNRTGHGAETALPRAVLAADSSLVVARLAIVESAGIGVQLTGADADLHDVLIDDVDEGPEGEFEGLGIDLQGAARLSAVAISNTRLLGFRVGQAGEASEVSLTDVSVTEVAGRESDHLFGYGIGIEGSMTAVDLTRVSVSRTREHGIFVDEAEVGIEDARVHEVAAERRAENHAVGGLTVQRRAAVTLRRVTIEATEGMGLAANVNGTIDAAELNVLDIGARGCRFEPCSGEDFGFGLGAFNSASITAAGVAVDGVSTVVSTSPVGGG